MSDRDAVRRERADPRAASWHPAEKEREHPPGTGPVSVRVTA